MTLVRSNALIEFTPSSGLWSEQSNGIAFSGSDAGDQVRFVVTCDALAELLSPDREGVDGDLALAVFEEYEQEIYRVAHRLYRQRGANDQPITLVRANIRSS